MKKRQRKKWGWHLCSHLTGPMCCQMCKKDGKECYQELCTTHEVPKFVKHGENLAKREAKRFVDNNPNLFNFD